MTPVLYHKRVISQSIDMLGSNTEFKTFDVDGSLDHNALTIEPFQMADNLMIVGSICRANKQHLEQLVPNGGLATSFEQALDMALEHFHQKKNEKSR